MFIKYLILITMFICLMMISKREFICWLLEEASLRKFEQGRD